MNYDIYKYNEVRYQAKESTMFIESLIHEPIFFLRVVAIVIMSICLHELGHGFAALSQGDDTPRKTGHLTLNPLVHMGLPSIIFLCLAGISWGAMPVNVSKFRHPKWSNILVSAAGPMTNLILGLIFLIMIRLIDIYDSTRLISLDFLYMAAIINLRLCLFNLVPLPPLDGFHIYSEFFPNLRRFAGTEYARFAFMLLFLVPVFGEGLNYMVFWIIRSVNTLLSYIFS
jgi:Zn-dependent protease